MKHRNKTQYDDKKTGMSLKTSHRTFRRECSLLLLLTSLWLWLLPAFSSTAVEESVLSDTPMKRGFAGRRDSGI